MQILDPGIGFAKDFDGNLQLLKHCGRLRQLVDDFPILLGPSRKGFIGKITGENVPSERDYGTAAACLAGFVVTIIGMGAQYCEYTMFVASNRPHG